MKRRPVDIQIMKIAHRERLADGREILAMITRFGDLAVMVEDENDPRRIVWQGENILEARAWAAANPAASASKRTGELAGEEAPAL